MGIDRLDEWLIAENLDDAWLLLPATLGPGALIALQEACHVLAALLAMAAAVAAEESIHQR